MGQKSSCCTSSDPPLVTEIDTLGQQDAGFYNYNGGQRNNKADLHVKGAATEDHEINLTQNAASNRILSTHIRQFSHGNAANKSVNDTAAKIQQLSEIVHYAPILKLKVISSSTLPKGHTITINAQGVEGSFRNKKDGITYFGCKKRLKRISKHVRQTEIINDYILPSVNPEISKKHRGQHFQIDYNVPSNSYKIKDLGVGFGTFYKLDFPLAFKDNHLINMGLIFMVANFVYNDQRTDSRPGETNTKETSVNTSKFGAPLLHLKLFGGPCNGSVQVIEPTSRPVVIGRHAESDIYVDDNLLSKFQCTVEYTDDNGWVLKDGVDKRPSTNGTWLYIGEDQTIYNGMIFKANQTLFQASLI